MDTALFGLATLLIGLMVGASLSVVVLNKLVNIFFDRWN